ncbi:MAG: TAXI family TRAP transporter solute-binding subunit [Janthinobacterium lividum]
MRNLLTILAATSALFCAHAAHAADSIGLCTGTKDGLYFGAGQSIAQAGGKSLGVTVIPSAGSWENLKAVADGTRCQAAIVQGDSLVAFARTNGGEARALRRATSLHKEYAHVICNRKSGISDAYDLMSDNKHPLAIGEEGGGSWITEQNWAALNKEFAKVPLIPEGGAIAAGMVADGNGASCMLYVSGLRSPAVSKINETYGAEMHLVPATGRLFRNAVNEKGEKLYEMEDIPAGTYSKLNPKGTFGGGGVEVPTMRAVLVVNATALGQDRYTALMDAVGRARARILADAGEK